MIFFFYQQVLEDDGLPPNICFRCINRIEIYTEYRDKCIENDKILRNLTSYKDIAKYIKKETDNDTTETVDESQNNQSSEDPIDDVVSDRHTPSSYFKAIQGIPEFYPDENSLVMVIDPNKEYDSSEQSDHGSVGSDNETSFQSPITQQANESLRAIFSCQYCDRAFTTQEENFEHETTGHDHYNPHKCNYCAYSTNQRTTVITHIREYHATDRPFICVECEKGFCRRSDLKKHAIGHTGIRPFTCPVCNKNFSRNTNLTKHLRIHTGHKPHTCPNCPRSFITKSDLIRHYNIHFNEKLFHCTICEAKFSRKDKLQTHQRKHHTPTIDPIIEPPKNAEPKPPIMLGVMQPPPVQQHAVDKPPVTEEHDTENMVIDLDPYQNMNHHQAGHQDNEDNANHQPPITTTNPAPNQFLVPEHLQNFDYIFPDHVTGDVITYQDLQGNAPRIDKRVFVCDQCPSKFLTEKSLRNHKNFHLGIRNHVCSICTKSFFRKRELDRHSVTHTGLKPFACSICSKRFGRKDKLVRHERIHSTDKYSMFKCVECPASFHRKEGLMAHMKLHSLPEHTAVELIETNAPKSPLEMEQFRPLVLGGISAGGDQRDMTEKKSQIKEHSNGTNSDDVQISKISAET